MDWYTTEARTTGVDLTDWSFQGEVREDDTLILDLSSYVTTTLSLGSRITVSVPGDITEALPTVGHARWDFIAVSGLERVQLVPPSPFTIRSGVTRV